MITGAKKKISLVIDKFTEKIDTFPLPFDLRTKITMPYLFLAILLIIGVGYLVTRIVFDTVEARFNNQLVESGKLASEGMVSEENRLLATLRLLANTSGIESAIKNGDADDLREMTFGAIVNNQEERVEFYDAAGMNLLTLRHKTGGNIEEYEFSSGGVANEGLEFVRKIFDQENDTLGDKYSGYAVVDGIDYFFVAGPILDDSNNLAGVILIGKTLETLAQNLREATLGQVTFYNLEGKVLASTFFDPEDLPSDRVEMVLQNQETQSLKRELSREISSNQISYAEIIGPWEGRGDVDLGILGVSLTKAFLVSATRVTRLQTILLAVLTLIVVVLVGLLISNLITNPIRKLARAAQQVAEGNLGIQVQSTTRDEISELMGSFNQMVRNLNQSNTNLLNSYDSTLEGWSKALELRDKETKGHTSRVTDLTVRIARRMGFSEGKLTQVRRGALLHDIGKMGIPDSILLKNSSLDEAERTVMKRHPLYAYEMLKHIDFLQPALVIPFYHHERWDGSGYPRGLKGTEIPLEARIFAIVDVWDAMRSDRPYRKALPDEEIIESIKKEIGAHFDPEVADLFLKMQAEGEL